MNLFSKLIILMALLSCSTLLSAQTHWSCDIHNYEYDMTLFLQLEDDGQKVWGDGYEVAAFCGEDCRGIAKEQTVTHNGVEQHYLYLRVRSNSPSGEIISFKVYKKSLGMEVDAVETVTFNSQEAVGLPSAPFTIHIAGNNTLEAYAVLSPDSTTLTFYYDENKATRQGYVYKMNDTNNFPEWYNAASKVKQVRFYPSFAAARPVSTTGWFSGMESLARIVGLEHLNTSEVRNMSRMFFNCKNLSYLDISSFTFNDDTNTQFFLTGCTSLQQLIISLSSNILEETSCSGVGTAIKPCLLIDPIGFDLGVEASNGTFQWKSGYFKVRKTQAYALVEYDRDKYYLENSESDDSYSVYAIRLTLYYDRYKDLRAPSHIASGNWPSDVEIAPLFNKKRQYATENRYSSGYSAILHPNDTFGMELWDILDNWTTWDVWEEDEYVDSICTFHSDLQYVEHVIIDSSFAQVKPVSLMNLFSGANNLVSIEGMENLNTSNATNMSQMFTNCWELTNLDVSHFDTSNVTNMNYMFSECWNLTSLDVSHFDTSNATYMSYMFGGCSSLTSLDVSNFDTSNVTNMSGMFIGCSSLKSLDLSSFDFSQVSNYTSRNLLSSCSNLQSLSISSTMDVVDATGCQGVGTTSSPCFIIAPDGFDFGVDTSGSYFRWKSGYFKLGAAFLLGDVNHDGAVSIADVMSVVDYIMGITPPVFFIENADMNSDGSISIADITLIVNVILHVSEAMVPEHVREQYMDKLVVVADADGYVIRLENHEAYTALQMDVVLPEGTELMAVRLENSRSDNHKVYYEKVASSRYRVIVYSQEGSEIRGSGGDLLQLVTYGTRHGSVAIDDVMLTNKQLETVVIPETSIVTGIDSPVIDDDDTPAFTIQGIPAEKHKRGVVVRKGSKRAVR